MGTVTRTLYGASTATTNDLAHLDIPYAARIIGIDINIGPVTAATGDFIVAEVSVASTGQISTNDANGVLGRSVAGAYILTTSGSASLGTNKFSGPMAIEIPAGTRIYLHTLQIGTSSTRIYCTLHLQR